MKPVVKQHSDGSKEIIHDVSSMSPDVIASKLTNDPIYGTFISSDVRQTRSAVSLLYYILALPVFLVAFDVQKKYGGFGLALTIAIMLLCMISGWRGMIAGIAIVATYFCYFV